MRIKKNTLYLLLGLILVGVLIWVAYDLPERQRQNRLDDYNYCVESRTKELYKILASCANGTIPNCDTTLTNMTIQKIDDVKEECRNTYLAN